MENLIDKFNNDSLNNSTIQSEYNFFEFDAVKVLLTCYWIFTMTISLVGNVSTCAIICIDRVLRTSTNCYLFNLAFIDVIITLLLPNEIYRLWNEKSYPFGCNVYHWTLWHFVTNISVFTITSLTIERYLVITKPFLRRKLTSKYRVLKIISGIWAITCCYNIAGLLKILSMNTQLILAGHCNIEIASPERVLVVIDMTVFFLIPLVIIIVLYIIIVIKVKFMKSHVSNSISSSNKDKAVKVLGAVVGNFLFCWSPLFILSFTALLPSIDIFKQVDVVRILHTICAINTYTSTAINPVIYYIMSSQFRKSYKNLLRYCLRTESSGQVNESREIT